MRIHLAGASSCFWRCWGATGALSGAHFDARTLISFLFLEIFRKNVFFYFVFVILVRVHLAGASRCFLALLGRSREAPGRYVRRAPGRQNGLAQFTLI